MTFDTEFAATGESAYIRWDDNGTTKYVGVSKDVSIYGGGDGREAPVTLPSTSIAMTGGKVRDVYGGNLGALDNAKNTCSKITGNVEMSFSGEAKVWNLLHGGGAYNTCVEGTVYMDFQNATAMNDPEYGVWPYVNGGVYGKGPEGTRNIEDGTMETFAVVNRVEITATNSNLYLVGGGGSGSTKVKDADVTLTNCGVNLLYLSGINGEVEKSSIVATDCTIGSFSATNRGFVGTGSVELNDCEITEKLNFGAGNGCFSSDSGTPDGSGVTGSVVWSLDDETTVAAAQLTPLVVRTGNANSTTYATTYENVTIQKEGIPLNVSVSDFTPVTTQGKTVTVKTFTVPENSTLILKGVEATVANGNMLTNAGTIDMDNASKLIVDSDAALRQAGTVTGTGNVENNGGTVTYYVARVGNAGYDTLEAALKAALEAATSNQTVTLLKDADLDADITISQNITIDGQGQFKIDAQPQNSHAITVAPNAALTLKDVTLNITDQEEQTGTYGLNVQYGATLTLDNADVTLAGLSNATISSNPNSAGTEPGKFVLTKGSTITANNIGGNFSNGGTWTIGAGSKVTIDGCDSHGFSASAITVENGATVDIRNIAYRGISINDANGKLEIQAGGVVNVTNAGTADDATTPRDAVYLDAKATEGLIVEAGATLNVTAGKDGNDRIALSSEAVSESELNGTIIGTVKLPENSTSYVVTYVSNNQQITTTIANQGTPIRLLNALPDQGYNHFVGWNDQAGNHYYGGQTVNITANTTFTAQWSYIPPPTPTTASTSLISRAAPSPPTPPPPRPALRSP